MALVGYIPSPYLHLHPFTHTHAHLTESNKPFLYKENIVPPVWQSRTVIRRVYRVDSMGQGVLEGTMCARDIITCAHEVIM